MTAEKLERLWLSQLDAFVSPFWRWVAGASTVVHTDVPLSHYALDGHTHSCHFNCVQRLQLTLNPLAVSLSLILITRKAEDMCSGTCAILADSLHVLESGPVFWFVFNYLQRLIWPTIITVLLPWSDSARLRGTAGWWLTSNDQQAQLVLDLPFSPGFLLEEWAHRIPGQP